MRYLSVLVTLFAVTAHAQTVTPPPVQPYLVDQKIPSLRAPFGYIVPYSITVQMETRSATTGKQVVTGAAFKIPAMNFVSDSALLADLVGNKTTKVPILVSSISVTLTTAMAAQWEQKAPWGLRVWLDKPFELAAGKTVGCRYDMPAQGFDAMKSVAETVSNMDLTIVWRKDITGNLRCAEGVKAASITPPAPAPVVVTPVTTPPGTPPGTTPPTTTPSKPGDSAPPLTELIALDGAKWTYAAGKIFRNGVDVITGNPSGYPDFKRVYVSDIGKICADGSVHGYLCWNGTAWGG